MDPDREEAEVFVGADDPLRVNVDEEEEQEEEGEEEKEEEDEEEDATIFNEWMQRYRGEEHQEKPKEEEDKEPDEGRSESRSSAEPQVRMRADRRASLPCPVRSLLHYKDFCRIVNTQVVKYN